jgi:hypothetical protein
MADPVLAAQIRHRHAFLTLLQDRQDLGVRESRFFHCLSPLHIFAGEFHFSTRHLLGRITVWYRKPRWGVPASMIAAVMVFLIALAACDAKSGSSRLDLSDEIDVRLSGSELAAFVFLDGKTKLPASASDVRVYENSFQDAFQFVEFSASESEAQRLLEALGGEPPAPGAGAYAFEISMRPDWWPATYPTNGRGIEVSQTQERPSIQAVMQPGEPKAKVWIMMSSF